jgi:hypothetical protein
MQGSPWNVILRHFLPPLPLVMHLLILRLIQDGAQVTPSIATPSVTSRTWLDPDQTDSNRATRIDRAVKIVLPTGGKDYNRGSFANHVAAVVGIAKLEACGPMAASHIWQLTFTDIPSRDRFIQAGDFSTRERHPASVTAIKKHRFVARVHWTPYHIPMAATVKQFDSISGLKVVSAAYDKSFIDGLQHVRSLQ